MTGRDRMKTAMELGIPDRVPLMCQLSLGFYFLNSSLDPFDIWYTSAGFARALIEMAERFSFDGILVNLPGRDPDLAESIKKIDSSERGQVIRFKDGSYANLPPDANADYVPAGGKKRPSFREVDPGQLFYIEPWDVSGVSYPYKWGWEKTIRPLERFFPDYHNDTLKEVIQLSKGRFSIHAEVFSPFTQLFELFEHTEILMALMKEPKKIHACLDQLTGGTIQKAREHAVLDIDALLISNPFGGGGFISPNHYQEFVVPYDQRLTSAIKEDSNIFVYQHICGKIGDRLEQILQTGADGIDTLDPPPLGDVDIARAKQILRGRAFIKGNLDPVNTLLDGDLNHIRQAARERINIAGRDGGYILSSACSVAPHTPPENIIQLSQTVKNYPGFPSVEKVIE